MTDATATAAPVATPAPAAPPAATADDVAALRAEIAMLTKAIAVQPATAAPAPAGPGVIKIVWGAGVRAWWASIQTAGHLNVLLAGLKTLLVFSVTGSLALLQEFNAIDLTPLISAFLPENTKLSVAGVITLMSVLGILLRLVTKSPIFRKAKATVAGGAPDSKVDEPVN